MKKVFLFIFAVLANISGFSQTKILFDATKAETAGNADWVIDTDQFNLGYNPNPHIGGNEANPQKIPTPAQSGITANTSQNYWKGAISAWAVDAVKQGYQVETLSYNGQITYSNSNNIQDLSNYKVFVVCEPNILFSSAEKTAILQFVQNGGGLFMISDHDNSDRDGNGYDSPYIWNDLMQNNSLQNNPFGITFGYEYFTESTTNIPNLPNDPLLHGNYGNVTSVEFYGGTSLTLNPSQNASVKGIVYRNGFSNSGTTGVLCSYATYGQGKVVALGDSSPADDGTGDTNDHLYNGWIQDANGNHERLIMNATIWLAEDTTTSVTTLPPSQPTISFIPTQTSIKIISDKDINCNLIITNIMGQSLINKNIFSNRDVHIKLNTNTIYFYQINTGSTNIKTGKFIIL